ncbi:MAG: carbamate kinase [Bacteroidota bacterium]
MRKLAVVAFGGNALLRGDQKGTINEQEQNAKDTCMNLLELVKNGYDLVVTHGNGPQVGNILLQNIAGAKMHDVPEMPLDICGAYSQGFIGYVIEQQFKNLLTEHNIERDVITLITQVLVDKEDPAFKNPTKPIGPFYSKEESDKIIAETGASFAMDPRGRGYRKVVASPTPLKINNRNTIESIARGGQIVVAVGGGGIPVYYKKPGVLEGIDAVIDKDLASALLATEIHANEFYILTDVPKVCINFHKPDEKTLDVITVSEARQYLADGHFAPGSMAPKVLAAINFVENGGGETIITEASQLGKPGCGTKIIAG